MNVVVLSGVILEKKVNKDSKDWMDIVLRVLENDVEDTHDKRDIYFHSKKIIFSVLNTSYEKSISHCRVGNYIEICGSLDDNYNRETGEIKIMKIYPRKIRRVARK